MKTLLALSALVLPALLLVGCEEPRAARPQTAAAPAAARPAPPAQPPPDATAAAPATPAPTPPLPPAAPAPSADLAGFAPDQVLSASFKGINDQGYPIVTLENLTGRDIDDIRGGFRLHDADGNILHATGLTIAVPGDLFIAAGAKMDSSPYGLNSKEDLMRLLATSPNELSFSFEAQFVTFMETQASAEQD